jgi:hypothetical protein
VHSVSKDSGVSLLARSVESVCTAAYIGSHLEEIKIKQEEDPGHSGLGLTSCIVSAAVISILATPAWG